MINFYLHAMRRSNVFAKARTKMRKMILAVLVVAMLFNMEIPAMAAGSRDSSIQNTPSKTAALTSAANDLLTGSGSVIKPTAKLKRYEMAEILVHAFGATKKGDISGFTDLSSGKSYAGAVAKAIKMGVFEVKKGKFLPVGAITRQDAYAAIASAFNLTTNDLSPLDKFSDKKKISSWAKPRIAALIAAGYIDGSSKKFNPNAGVTGAEIARVMDKMVSTYITKAGTYKKLAKGNVMINVPDVTIKGATIKGDLIIGDGVGTGNVTLDAVKILGRTVVRGGGKNSIHVINGSTIKGVVIIDNVNNEVRIVTDEGTTVEKIEAGSQLLLEGNFGDVKIVGSQSGSNTSVEVKGNVQTLTVETKAEVSVSGTVTTVEVAETAKGTTINTTQDAKIETILANAQSSITGNGTVTSVEAKADNVNIDTAGTKVTTGQGVTGVTVGGREIPEGSTVTTPEAVPTPTLAPTSTPTPAPSSAPTGPIVVPPSTQTQEPPITAPTVSKGSITGTDSYHSIKITMSGALTNTSIGDADAGDCSAFTVTGTSSSHPQHVVVQTASGISCVYLAFDSQISAATAINGGISVSYTPTGTRNLANGTAQVAAFSNIPVTKVVGDDIISDSGTYGPASGTITIEGNVTINAAGATLKNLLITGDLTFGAGIGSGDAYINNVTVQGRTLVNGGGSHSIHIQGTSTLGVVEVNDQRTDKSEPINIEAEGTGSIDAVTVTSMTPVKITPDTNTIGFVAAVDGSTVTYAETSNKEALLDKIVEKSNYILDHALTGTNDSNYQVNDIDSLVSGIIDTSDPTYQMYKISCLKYYFNPLSGVAGRESDLDTLNTKLTNVQNTVDVIALRDGSTPFVSTMYDKWFPGNPGIPDIGFNQMTLSMFWDVFNRYITLEGYGVNASGTIVAAGGNTSPDANFISTAQTLCDKLKTLQNLWTVVNVVAIDSDNNSILSAGDIIKIKFERRLRPDSNSEGELAINALISSDARFGSGAVVSWNDNATVIWFDKTLHVSECTITLGDAPNSGLLSDSLIIPKNKLGSYIPDGDLEYLGDYGSYITNDPPIFDVSVSLPSELYSAHVPALDAGSVRVNKKTGNSGSNLERGDTIEMAFDSKLSQDSISSISNWVNGNASFGTGTEPGGKCVFTIPDVNVTKLGIQLGTNPTLSLGASFTIPQDKVYSPAGQTAAGGQVVNIPTSFSNIPAVQSLSVVNAVHDSISDNQLAAGDTLLIKFDRGLSFGQMDAVSVALAATGAAFGIPAGSYSNRTQVPGVNWSSNQTTVAISLQSGFTLSLSGSNTINCSAGTITVNQTVTAFTDGVSDVVVSQNGSTYDVSVTFFNHQDAINLGLRDGLAASLGGTRNDPGSTGNTVMISGVAADKIGTTITILSDKTSCGTAYGFVVPAAQ